jgi:exopolysaccharide production protein ExoQ
MIHASASTARGDRMTRSTRTVALDRHSVVHRLIGGMARAVESSATILTMILISDAILPLFLHEGPSPLKVTAVTGFERACYWLAYAFTMVEVLLRPRQIYRTALRNPYVLGIVLLAGLSMIWSDDPSTTLKRTVALVVWTLFGYFLASRYDTSELLWHLAIALGIMAVASLATVVLKPDYGREIGAEGAWRGVFTTKNVLGEMMLLAAVVFGTLTRRRGWARVAAVLALIIAVILIAFAKATAALLIVGVLVVTLPVVLTFRRNNAAAALIFCTLLGVGAAGSVAIAEGDAVLSVLGKDPTLTGRTVLWAQVISHIEDRPLLGHGFGAFWEPTAAASERIRTAIGWDAPHSHNGWLDEWLDLGLVGVLCLLGAYVLSLRRAWSGLRATVAVDGLWAMGFLVMLFLGNITESSISSSLLLWAIFVAVASMRWAPTGDVADANSRSRSRPRARARASVRS